MSRSGTSAAAVLVTLVAAVAARATGTIETDAATKLSVGAAPHPGFVIVDPYARNGTAPALPTVVGPSAFVSAPAAPPSFDAGPGGSDLAFSTSATVPGGTYDCAAFSVAKFVVVTFTGPTTIRAAASVTLDGAVRTLGDDQPLTILTNGDLRIFNQNINSAAATTSGARSDLTLRSGARFLAAGAYSPHVAAFKSSLFVSGWTMGVGADALSAGLDVEVVAAGDVWMTARNDPENGSGGGAFLSAGRDAMVRSALSDVHVAGPELRVAGRLSLEAGGNVSIADETSIVDAGGGLDVSAHGGRIDVAGGAIVTAGKVGAAGVSTWRARDGISATGRSTSALPAWSTTVACGSSKFVLESTAGDVELGMDGTSTPPHELDADGSIEIRAAGTVRVRGTGRVTAKTGATATGLLGVSLDAGASIDAGAGTLFAASPETVSLGAGAVARGGAVSLSASKVVSVAAGAPCDATTNDLVVVAHDVAFNGTGKALRGVRIATTGGVADVRGATLSSRDAASGVESGAVEVIAYQGPDAALLAQGATLRSGSSTTTSGDVVLRVVGAPRSSGGSETPETTRSDPPYVVPVSVVVRPRRRSAAQDLTLKGFIDLGTTYALAPVAATVAVGGVERTAALVVARSGAATARGADVVVSIGRPRAGSPRRSLTLRASGAFLPSDLSGELRIVLTLGGVDASCRVSVEDGRFDLRRGALLAPALYVAGVKPVKNGLVRVTLGLPSNVVAASEAPSIVVELAGSRWYVERTQFLATRGRFAATSPAVGLAALFVDPRARTIDVDVAAATLGLSAAGGPLEIALRVNGGATRLMRVVVGTARGKLVY